MKNNNRLYPDLQEGVGQKQVKRKYHRGTYLEGRWIESKAYCTMRSPASYLVFSLMTSQLIRDKKKKRHKHDRQEYDYLNERNLKLTYLQAEERYGITQPSFTRAIDELVGHGFLDIVKAGNPCTKEPTVYGLSDRWIAFGTDSFRIEPRVKEKRGWCRSRAGKAEL